MDTQEIVELESAVECVRHRPADGEAQPEPPFYDERYSPPAHRVKLLETLNPSKRDLDIRFLAAPHIYLVNNQPIEISVTSVVGAFMSRFDPDQIITMMARGTREAWPRLKYAHDAHTYDDTPRKPGRCTLLVNVDNDKTLWTGVAPEGCDVAWALSVCSKRDKAVRQVKWYHYERAMSAEEIKLEWQRNGTRAGNMGTECHLLMELWSNSEPVRRCPEMQNGLTFVRDVLVPLGVKAFRTEWEVYTDEAIGVAGSIDWVGQFPDGSLIIVDWKRTGADKHDVHDRWGKQMLPPLSHLDETDICKFALQLSMYAYILSEFYGYKIRALALCSIHPDHKFHTFVPYLDKEVKFLCARRRARVAAKLCMERDNADLPRCSISGRVAWEPVRVDGILCDAKYAAWRYDDKEATRDDEACACIATAEAAMHFAPSAEELQLTYADPWKMRIPAEGWSAFTPCGGA